MAGAQSSPCVHAPLQYMHQAHNSSPALLSLLSVDVSSSHGGTDRAPLAVDAFGLPAAETEAPADGMGARSLSVHDLNLLEDMNNILGSEEDLGTLSVLPPINLDMATSLNITTGSGGLLHDGMTDGHAPGPADLDFGDAVFDEDDWMDQDNDQDQDDNMGIGMGMDGADMYGVGDNGHLNGSLGMIEVPSFQEEMYGSSSSGAGGAQQPVNSDCCSVFGGGGRGATHGAGGSGGSRSFVERICGPQKSDNSYPQQQQPHQVQHQNVFNPVYKRK